jgi:hypothetical protein
MMDALIPHGGERIKMGKIACPCCEKLFSLRSNGHIGNLKSHLERSKRPGAPRLLKRLNEILEVKLFLTE